MIKNVFFDLDGTLLPMDMDTFTNGYFAKLTENAEPYGYKKDELIKVIWGGVKAMVMNGGKGTNEEAFWNYFCSVYGEEARAHKVIFDEFYANDFIVAKNFTGYNPDAKDAVDKIKENGYRIVLATNPIFPEVATLQRISWAGLDVNEFEFYTTYENSTFCKPNPEYYAELAEKVSVNLEETLMVGNDVSEDMEAGLKAGMKVFLITDCLINRENIDINKYPHGTFNDLLKYLELL